MRSILVVNPKGGCGKTTLATNLASYYAVWETSVALIDLDPQQSSLHWLSVRPKCENPIQGFNGLKGVVRPNEDTQRIIYDAPARTDTAKVVKLINQVDVALIPILPSAIDMRASASFIVDLTRRMQLSGSKTHVGVVANKIQENFHSYALLIKFLDSLNVSFVGSVRNSQNYIRAADSGIGIFEMPMSKVEKDMQQWKCIVEWVEKNCNHKLLV